MTDFVWPAAALLAVMMILIAAMSVLAGRRDPDLAARMLQTALIGQTVARLVVLILSVPLIGYLGMGGEINRTAAIAALAGIAGSAIGGATGARLPGDGKP